MKKASSIIYKGQTWTGHPDAIAAFEAMLQRDAERKASIPGQSIKAAFQRVAFVLRELDHTEDGVQLKRLLWSLRDEQHYVNLHKLVRILHWKNMYAVEVIFSAYMRCIVNCMDLDRLMEVSGENRRMKRARAETGGTKPVDYPRTPRWLREHILKLGPVDH
jgi:hypothetical protein